MVANCSRCFKSVDLGSDTAKCAYFGIRNSVCLLWFWQQRMCWPSMSDTMSVCRFENLRISSFAVMIKKIAAFHSVASQMTKGKVVHWAKSYVHAAKSTSVLHAYICMCFLFHLSVLTCHRDLKMSLQTPHRWHTVFTTQPVNCYFRRTSHHQSWSGASRSTERQLGTAAGLPVRKKH